MYKDQFMTALPDTSLDDTKKQNSAIPNVYKIDTSNVPMQQLPDMPTFNLPNSMLGFSGMNSLIHSLANFGNALGSGLHVKALNNQFLDQQKAAEDYAKTQANLNQSNVYTNQYLPSQVALDTSKALLNRATMTPKVNLLNEQANYYHTQGVNDTNRVALDERKLDSELLTPSDREAINSWFSKYAPIYLGGI
jgi:hypothetical protein